MLQFHGWAELISSSCGPLPPSLWGCERVSNDSQSAITLYSAVQVVAKHHKQFMAAPSLILIHTNNLSSPFPLSSPKCYKNQTLNENSFLNLKKQSLLPNLLVKNPRTKNPRSAPVVVFAAQSNFLKGQHFPPFYI